MLPLGLAWTLWCLAPLALATSEVGSGSSFTPGLVCSDDDEANVALRGKHLTVMELAWAPYAKPDPAAPKGWSGMNIELIDALAEILGFTYDIVDIGYPTEGQTWTDHAFANIENGDLLMSFWFKNFERLKKMVYVEGHLDVSPSLIARREKSENKDPWSFNSVTSFMLPFTWELWACLVALVLLSGVTDYLIERKRSPDARLSASLYEYAAGFLWGGFEYPLSTASKFFQILLGFILLIVVSTYTANLAAFITLSAQPGLSVTSVDMAMSQGKPLCMEEGGYNDRITANYPKMKYELIFEAQASAPRLRDAKSCDGIMAPKTYYDGWRTDASYCNFEITQTFYPDTAGWMSNKKSQCVVNAINYAMLDLKVRGILDRLYLKYFPVIACESLAAETTIDSPEEEPETSRRRLVDITERRGPTADATGELTPRAPGLFRRVLKGGNAGDGGGPSAAESDETFGVPRIGLDDLKGLFIFWGIVSIGLVTWTYTNATLWKYAERFGCAQYITKVVKILPNEDGDVIDSPDNELAYLRKLIRQSDDARADLTAIMSSMGIKRNSGRFRDMARAFQMVDADGSGTLDKKEVLRALELFSIDIDESKLDGVISSCDRDGDGLVDYKEFIDVLAKDMEEEERPSAAKTKWMTTKSKTTAFQRINNNDTPVVPLGHVTRVDDAIANVTSVVVPATTL